MDPHDVRSVPRMMQSAHWGAYEVSGDGAELVVQPADFDSQPSPLLRSIASSAHHPSRIESPAVRRGWLEGGPGPDTSRGAEEFVTVSWEEAESLLADELARVYARFGSSAVFGGSYGWGSAGRFHHAQSQVHRFLNCLGGYVRSVNNYSNGASSVILRHVLGDSVDAVHGGSSWDITVDNADLVVAFGGLSVKNLSIAPGGITDHRAARWLSSSHEAKPEFVLVSPLRDDMPQALAAEWLPTRPGTDSAVMLALLYTLIRDDLVDRNFVRRYCEGFGRLRSYVLGDSDGLLKSPQWASGISGIAAGTIARLARTMACRRTFITVSWSLQRGDHGEQPPWLAVALAAALGQIGLPGGGFGLGYGSMGDAGNPAVSISGMPTLPQGSNAEDAYIPVARITDMLLNPGAGFEFGGQSLEYPDIKLVYWCGGNPFHHQQDLRRLTRAFGRPDTVIVHDCYWTATARHADIVIPATIPLERNDIGASRRDRRIIAMHRALQPYADSRDDFTTFTRVAVRLGVGERFTEGRSADEWIRHLYDTWCEQTAQSDGFEAPAFDEFWRAGYTQVPGRRSDTVLLADFRADPEAHALRTPSGRIELFSRKIESFGYDDCLGHPAWLEPRDWANTGRFPICLIANQPALRLHSQLDVGALSCASKVQGREPVRMSEQDAAARNIGDGDVVRLFNDRGSCLVGAVISDDVAVGCAQMSVGAWYEPRMLHGIETCIHGNPNTLTMDVGTSRLSQSSVGSYAQVEIERMSGNIPEVTAHRAANVGSRRVASEL